MVKRTLAERVLGWVTSRDDAAAVVGDLLEEDHGRGQWWLLWAVAKIVAHKYGRGVAALAVALLFTSWKYSPETMVMKLHPVDLARASYWSVPVIMAFNAGWMYLPYMLVRYGWKDAVTQACAVVFVLFNVAWFRGPDVTVSAASLVVLAALVVGGASTRRYRGAAAMLVVIALVNSLNLGLIIKVQEGEISYADRHHAALVFWPQTVAIYVWYVNLLLTVPFVKRWMDARRERVLVEG
jgi:hypothetical protein